MLVSTLTTLLLALLRKKEMAPAILIPSASATSHNAVTKTPLLATQPPGHQSSPEAHPQKDHFSNVPETPAPENHTHNPASSKSMEQDAFQIQHNRLGRLVTGSLRLSEFLPYLPAPLQKELFQHLLHLAFSTVPPLTPESSHPHTDDKIMLSIPIGLYRSSANVADIP